MGADGAEMGACAQLPFLPYSVWDLAYGVVLLTCRVGLPTSISVVKSIPNRQAHGLI